MLYQFSIKHHNDILSFLCPRLIDSRVLVLSWVLSLFLGMSWSKMFNCSIVKKVSNKNKIMNIIRKKYWVNYRILRLWIYIIMGFNSLFFINYSNSLTSIPFEVIQTVGFILDPWRERWQEQVQAVEQQPVFRTRLAAVLAWQHSQLARELDSLSIFSSGVVWFEQ